MNVLKRKYNRAFLLTDKFLAKLFNTISFLITRDKDKLLINSWISFSLKGIRKNNWGDDINYWLFKELSGKKIFNISDLFVNCLPKDITNILPIGSIIEYLGNENSIIWGSGAQNGVEKIDFKPKKILAVRGPKTRELLLSKGIQCPEIYGDPALLLSKIYKPSSKKKYKIGIIPHYVDFNNPLIKEFAESSNDITIISMNDYKNWQDIPDKINECEFILSSSLHGLIISDSYNVPNVWVSFSDRIKGGAFKYLDYFASVGRVTKESISINKIEDFINAQNELSKWRPISIDLNPLIKCCPFAININKTN